MLDFIKKLILFLFVFVLFYSIIIILIGNEHIPSKYKQNLPIYYSNSSRMFEDLRVVKKVDILFVGSSHCYRSFDPRIFAEKGFSIFNLGTSSQTPVHSEILLNEYIDKLNPNEIILEVFPFTFSTNVNFSESSLDIISSDSINKYFFNFFVLKPDIRYINLVIYKFWKKILNRKMQTKKNSSNIDEKYIFNGYVEKKQIFINQLKLAKQFLKYDNKQFQALKNILNLCREKNIKFTLIFAPITNELYKSIINIDEFNFKMKYFGNYINFNENYKYNDTIDFYDSHHLNANGVKKLNLTLLEILNPQ
jgi:hypothetical protein